MLVSLLYFFAFTRTMSTCSPMCHSLNPIHPWIDCVTLLSFLHIHPQDILELFMGISEVTLEIQDHHLPIEEDLDDWTSGPEYQRRVCLTRGDLGLGIEVCGDEVRWEIFVFRLFLDRLFFFFRIPLFSIFVLFLFCPPLVFPTMKAHA